jgi:hypothetical protein
MNLESVTYFNIGNCNGVLNVQGVAFIRVRGVRSEELELIQNGINLKYYRNS